MNLKELITNIHKFSSEDYISFDEILTKETSLKVCKIEINKEIHGNFVLISSVINFLNYYSNSENNAEILSNNFIYYYNNLIFPNDHFIDSLNIITLLNNLSKFNYENSFYIENLNDIYSKVIVIWFPWDDEKKQIESEELGDKLSKKGFYSFDNFNILEEWKNGYIEFLLKNQIPLNDALIAALVLYESKNNYSVSKKSFEDLINYICLEPSGKKIPNDFFDRPWDY